MVSGSKMPISNKTQVMSFVLSFGHKQKLQAAECKESIESQVRIVLGKEK